MNEKIDPWKSFVINDYEKLFSEFGIKPFEPFIKKLPNPPLLMQRGMVIGHRDFDKIADKIKKKEPFVMMTGLMPSGMFHLGHKMVAEQIIYYQSLGAKIFLCVADIEAYNMRGGTLEELRKVAIDQYLLNYIALGLKPKNCDFYFQSDRDAPYYRLAKMLAKRVTANEFKDIYGDNSPGKMFSVLTQVADILHPQLKEYGGIKDVVVPVGVDQDPHLRLTRDIANRASKELGLVPPASTYHKFLPGLKGGKMSSSDPLSYIALTDNPNDVKRKINKYAFSGGQPSVEEHRTLGGNPDIDVSYQLLHACFEPDDKKLKKFYGEYKSGRLLTGELKQIAIERVSKFLNSHQKKRVKARSQVNKFLKK
ncbi:MAG: tryptophan--tRNA ligase [Nanoarchaeota archaeon]|nr:tryptophan--tRNA ligase [Nanoarchaeota archaeon]MBU1135407.1 tryptophan--tRNA ligase [Nanoarchaeota archaeon]MBU2519793.1 tryptophan--tRNA ligase [Nanoarchaeota archaeon]